MKIKLFLLTFCIGFMSLKAQFPNPQDFSSATNSINNGTLSLGTNDLHWSAALTNSLGPYVPAVSCSHIYSNWASSTSANANWISYPHTCDPNSPAEHSCLNPSSLDIFYKLAINLPTLACGSVASPSVYCLSLNMYADNSVYEIFVNGVSNYINPSSNPYFDMGYSPNASITVQLCNNWQPGNNTVIIHVKSGNGSAPTWEALLITATQTVDTSANTALTATSTQTNVKCFGDSDGIAAVNPVGGTGSYSYTWAPFGGNLNSASNLSAGIYTVQIVSSNSCTLTHTINLTQPNAISISINTTNAVYCVGQQVIYTASGAANYTWMPGNITGTTFTASPSTNTNYTVIGSDANGCTAAVSFVQHVVICEGINEIDMQTVRIYPNPTKGIFELKNLNPNSMIEISNTSGDIIYKGSIASDTVSIDLSKESKGIYLIKISSLEGTMIKKIIKE